MGVQSRKSRGTTRVLRRIGTARTAALILGLLVGLGASVAPAQPGPRSMEAACTYDVTVQNLTGGQALTPPVVATYTTEIYVSRVGWPASSAVQAIAENGNNTPLLDTLTGASYVFDSRPAGDGPLVPVSDPGGAGHPNATSTTITADYDVNFLFLIAMLICTNDGLTGLNTVRLPAAGSEVYLTAGYDAGTGASHGELRYPRCRVAKERKIGRLTERRVGRAPSL